MACVTAQTGHKLREQNHLLVAGSCARRLGWYSWSVRSHLVFLSTLQALFLKQVGMESSTSGMHEAREEVTYISVYVNDVAQNDVASSV